ncbi:uncharacterized protein [Temnothorax nylanderi]|uniref:uncharacterized protein isoform X2 n=1 Tax=Temnothorax nylanderi TaxID=102681 RepID=UPI003A870729
MEAHVRAPDPLTKNGDMASNWQTWKEDFIIFMKVTGYIDKPNEIRANLLKNRIGKVGIEAIQNMSFDNMQDRDDMDILIKKLEEYFNPPKKEVVERYQFFTRSKRQNESIEQYINILKEKAKTCNFNDMTESIIRDKIILDTHDKILRKKFFEADNLDLLKLVAIYNDYNINTEKMKQVTAENKAEPTRFPQKPPDNNAKRVCWRCNHQHPQRKCFAWGSKCTKCGGINHFTQCCKGPKFKMSDNKVNKNLLDSVQQTKFIPKKNNKWNNEADSAVKTMDSMTKMTSLPDIPTSSNAANPAVGNDPASDFVILNTSNTSSKLCYDNTTNYSAHLPKNTQYNYSYTKEVKPNGIVTDLYNRGENIQPKQTKTARVDAAQVPTDFLLHVTKHKAAHNTPTFRKERKKKVKCENSAEEEEDEMFERELAEDAQWKRIQQNTFTRWANERLKAANKHIGDLECDLSDGLRLVSLIEVLSQKRLPKHNQRPTFRSQKLENVSVALKFLEDEGIRIVNIDSSDIVDCKLKLILGLIWTLILHYSISMPMWEGDDGEDKGATPKQRLMHWIQSKVPDLPITNFTSDWNDGRAVGALVDAVAPGLCPDWQDWNPKDAIQNASEAMGLADDWLNIPQLIKPEEMVNPNIDEMSMMTYLSQYPSAKLKSGAPLRARTNPNRVRAYGPGIEPTGPIVGAPANFTVEIFSAGKGNVDVIVDDPKGNQLPVDIRFNKDRNLTYSVSYTPKTEGPHKVKVLFAGREIPKSPYTVNVEGHAGDPDEGCCLLASVSRTSPTSSSSLRTLVRVYRTFA